MFGEDATVGEFSAAGAPDDSKEPAASNLLNAYGRDFANGNGQQGTELGVENPELFSADEDLCGGGTFIVGLEAASVNDDKCAEFAGFFVHIVVHLRRGQQNGCDEKRQAADSEQVTVPQPDRQNDQSGAYETHDDPKSDPGARIASKMKNSGNLQDNREKDSDDEVTQPNAKTFGLRCDWVCRRAHTFQLALAFKYSRSQTIDLAHSRKGAANVRDSDGAADDQGDIQGVDDFLALPTLFTAANQMISDAVVAAKHSGSNQAQQLF